MSKLKASKEREIRRERLHTVNSTGLGIAYVSVFLILANANAVFSGHLLQTLHPFTFLFWSFFISTVFFGVLLIARNGLGALAVDRVSLVPLLTLNATSAFNWIGYFFALRFIEPAIVSAIMGGLGPLSTILLERALRGRRLPSRIYVPAAGVLVGAGLLAWASLTGRSGLKEISIVTSATGLAASAVGGVSQALNTVATKQLGDRGWGSTQIMTHRFYLLLIVAAGFALTGPGLSVHSGPTVGMMLIATVMGVIAPLWPLQRGIILSEPFTIAVMLSLAPILTYLFQGFDNRMHWSAVSAAGCAMVAVCTIYGTRIIHQREASMSSGTGTESQKILVVVDGYSSGSQLPSVMKEHGWKCVHVRALDCVPPYYLATFNADEYIGHFTYEGDIAALARAVATYRPSAVLPGTESGVIVAERLAAELGLPGNDPSYSNAHRDKYEMHNRLKQAGLRGMDHYLARDFDGLLSWARGGCWPVVLKPPASAGTDSVTFCRDPGELENAFHRMYGAVNQLGDRNDAVLAQRFLSGQEYFINGISGNGRHVITEIWRTEKVRVPGAGMIYDRSILLDPTQPEMAPIVEYVHRVLDALSIRYGAHHTELMDTDEGPTLIECASRLSGGLNRPAANYAVGISMLDLVANLVVEGESYADRLAEGRKSHQCPLWQVQFISNQSGVVSRSFYGELMATLRSKTWLQKAPKPGDSVMRTTDLFSSPGIIFMSHSDVEVLQQDCATVRQWEGENRLFTVE
ncbi:MAG: ATP-grasp domain-containing protein [Pseudonocardiales bacterium]|nr:ATP-grasp domain-containing protein [Pseudonocardiales bacterium]